MSTLYPIFLKLEGKTVLVAGGGAVALRRVERLLEAGARVTLVCPEAVEGLRAFAMENRIEWRRRKLEPGDLRGASLALLATGDESLAREMRDEAARQGVLFSSAEDASLSDFHVPAVAARGGAQVAVSTGGASPGGAARIRDELEPWLEQNEPRIAEAIARGRTPAPGPGLCGPEHRAEAGRGKVYLVGAGPGAPGLLTLRAAEILKEADIVLHDRLVPDAILERIPRRAERIYVGKEVGCRDRADIEKLLVEHARAGKRVVRLKGGDPLVFGRGGEEVLALVREGIELEVVPGVSALSSVPAAAGIPVTLRGVSSEIVVRSGHARESDAGAESREGTTFVYFMAARYVDRIAAELRAEGLPDSTPVAVVQRGTLPGQKTMVTTLGGLEGAAAREPFETPALLVAGEVVRLREEMLSQLSPLLVASAASESEVAE